LPVKTGLPKDRAQALNLKESDPPSPSRLCHSFRLRVLWRDKPASQGLMPLTFRPDLRQQLSVGFLEFVEKIHAHLQLLGVLREPFPQRFRGWIVKERNILVQIRHDQLVAYSLVMHDAAETAAER
jgi:hypothetical protein